MVIIVLPLILIKCKDYTGREVTGPPVYKGLLFILQQLRRQNIGAN